MLASEFVPTPAATHDYLTTAGLIPLAGCGGQAGDGARGSQDLRVVGPIQESVVGGVGVRIAPDVTDRFRESGRDDQRIDPPGDRRNVQPT